MLLDTDIDFVTFGERTGHDADPATAEPEKPAARERDDRDETFNRRDFVMLMISLVITALGLWWVAPQ